MISIDRSAKLRRLLRGALAAIALACCTHAAATQVCLDSGNSAALEFWLGNFEDNGQDDEIRLRSGSFVPAENDSFRFRSFESKNLIISGGWNAGCTSQRGQPETVLDGNETTSVMRLQNQNGTLTVSRLTFIDGFSVSFTTAAAASALGINGEPGFGTGATIELNKFLFNRAFPFAGNGRALSATNSSGNLRVRNSLFVGNEEMAALVLMFETSQAYVSNNTFVLNGSEDTPIGGLQVNAESGNTVVLSNNILWLNVGLDLLMSNGVILHNNDIESIGGEPGAASAGNISVNPQFDGILGFKLKPVSPLVNAGRNSVPGGLTLTDLDSATRLQGLAVDIGAYETDVLFASAFD